MLTKHWIPPSWPEGSNSVNCHTTHRPLPDTNCWSKDFDTPGIFHQWGNNYEEFEGGPGNYTIAIVERGDGTVDEVLVSNLKFVNFPPLSDEEKLELTKKFEQYGITKGLLTFR